MAKPYTYRFQFYVHPFKKGQTIIQVQAPTITEARQALREMVGRFNKSFKLLKPQNHYGKI